MENVIPYWGNISHSSKFWDRISGLFTCRINYETLNLIDSQQHILGRWSAHGKVEGGPTSFCKQESTIYEPGNYEMRH
jgi:hypothetical protein